MQQMPLFEFGPATIPGATNPHLHHASPIPGVEDRGIPVAPIQMGENLFAGSGWSSGITDGPGGLHGTNWARFAEAPADADLGEIGATGLDLTTWGLARDAARPELAGRNLRRIVKEMADTDPVTGAMLNAIEMLVRQVDWHVLPAEGDDSDEGKAAAAFVESCLHDMNVSWADVVTEILTFLPYGWSFFETVYKVRGGDNDDPRMRSVRYDDGLIGWRKWAPRKQDSLDHWEFDKEGGISGMWQVAPPDYKPRLLPIQKALLFRTRPNTGHPEGRSVLLNAIRPYKFKKRIEEFEAIGIERDLAGLPYMRVPRKLLARNLTDPNDIALRDMLRQIVTGVRRNEQEGLLLPSDVFEGTNQPQFSFDLLSSGGSRQYQTDTIIDRLKHDMATTLMCDWLLLGQNRVGSYALSSDKTDLFAVSLGTYLGIIRAVVNAHAIPRLFQFAVNRAKFPNAAKNPPRLAHRDIETADLGVLGTFVSALKTAGLPLQPNKALTNYLLEQAGLPLPTEDEQKQQQDAAEQAKQQGMEGAAKSKEVRAQTQQQTASEPWPDDVESPDSTMVEFHTPGGKPHNQKNHTRKGYLVKNPKLVGGVSPKIQQQVKGLHAKAAGAAGVATTGKALPAGPKFNPAPKALDTADMKVIGGQGGSNPGAMYQDKAGTKWYIKYPHGDAESVKHKLDNEILAGKLYELAGVPVAQLQPAVHNGKPAIASKVVDVDDLGISQMKGKADVLDGFAVDAWLANWDVVGNGSPSQMNLKRNKATGKSMRLDTGGALLYRAQGGKKGAAFGTKVGEIDTFRDKQHNSGKVFGGMTNKQIVASMDRVLALKPADIAKAVRQYGPGSKEEKESLLDTLLKRQDDIRQRRAQFAQGFNESGVAVGVDDPQAFHHPGGKPHNQKNHTRKGYLSKNPKLVAGLSQGQQDKWKAHNAKIAAGASVAGGKVLKPGVAKPTVADHQFGASADQPAPKDRKAFLTGSAAQAVHELFPQGQLHVSLVEQKGAGKGALAYYNPLHWDKANKQFVEGYIRIGPSVGADLAPMFSKSTAKLTDEQAGRALGAAKVVLHEYIHATYPQKDPPWSKGEKLADNKFYKYKANHTLEEGFTELGSRVLAREFVKRSGLGKLRPELLTATPPKQYKNYPTETRVAHAITNIIAFHGQRTYTKTVTDIAIGGTAKSRGHTIVDMWLKDSGADKGMTAAQRRNAVETHATALRGALTASGAGADSSVHAFFHELADTYKVKRHRTDFNAAKIGDA